jgi:hypothetical protein
MERGEKKSTKRPRKPATRWTKLQIDRAEDQCSIEIDEDSRLLFLVTLIKLANQHAP